MNCARLSPGRCWPLPYQDIPVGNPPRIAPAFPLRFYFAVEGAVIVVLAVLHAGAIRRSGSDAVAN